MSLENAYRGRWKEYRRKIQITDGVKEDDSEYGTGDTPYSVVRMRQTKENISKSDVSGKECYLEGPSM